MKDAKDTKLDPRRKAAYRRMRIFAAVLTFGAAILAIACLIGIIVAVLMLNFGTPSERRDFVLYVLTGSFTGGAALFALCTYLSSKFMTRASERELDFRERLDGEESFFVGEGTLLTFGDEGITLHAETESGHEPVFVPYNDTRYFSICTRRRPAEKGNWCVAIEIPVKYLSKKKDADQSEKVLVQADAKERLVKSLEKHNLSLLGEERSAEKENKKFVPVKKFYLPNRKKRRNALILGAVAILFAGGSIPLGILYSASIGALFGAAGVVLLARAIASFIRAKAVFGVYEEGVYWKESGGAERLFLKWDDIEEVTIGEDKGYPVLTLQCMYGRYAIPAVEGAYECIKGLREEKCTKEN